MHVNSTSTIDASPQHDDAARGDGIILRQSGWLRGTASSPCARSEKRPRNEVSFRVPGNICFFALMGRKHDAEVESTCCHSQKSAKVGFSKGFLADLIGPDRVADTSRGQPARRRWEDETMAISCKTMHLVVV